MKYRIDSTEELLCHIGLLADEYGTEVYVVGGFLRDEILGQKGKDIDFTVTRNGMVFAQKLAESLGISDIISYEKFGTCMIPYKDFKLEFVQARGELYEPDSRKPNVTDGDLFTDLQRRDFTINTLAKRLTKSGLDDTIVDHFNGIADLSNKVLRTPLDPMQTFDDDPLRMIRAFRFASRFELTIDDTLIEAIKKNRDRIKIVSQERITHEFLQIMQTGKPSIGLDLLRVSELLEVLYPELQLLIGVEQRSGFHHKDVWFHTLKVVDNVAKASDDLYLRLAALYHDIAKPKTKRFVENIGWTFHGHDALGANMVNSIFKKHKIPLMSLAYVQKLIRLHLRPINLSNEEVTASAIRRLVVDAGSDLDDLLTLCRADITSGNPNRVKRHLENFDIVEQRISEVEELDALKTFQSPVRGEEIMEVCGLEPSPMIGKLKAMIEEAILDGTIPYEYDSAYKYLLKLKDEVLHDQNSTKTKEA